MANEFIEKEVAEAVKQVLLSAIAAGTRWFRHSKKQQPVRTIRTRSGSDRRQKPNRRGSSVKLRLRAGLLHQYHRATGEGGGAEITF
jgi:hypothetical protein